MPTKLDKPLKREIDLDGRTYTLTISPEGVKITEKGHRKGHELSWRTLLSGDVEIAEQLSISLDATSAEGSESGGRRSSPTG